MRNILFVFIGIALIASGCKKEDAAELINPSASMSAKLGGTSWSAVTRVTRLQSGTFIITGTGTISGNQVINITLLDINPGVHTLNAGQGTIQFSATYTPVATSTDSIFQATSGTVNVTSIDATNKKISGTFSFDMTHTLNPLNTLSVTEGKFENLSYTE